MTAGSIILSPNFFRGPAGAVEKFRNGFFIFTSYKSDGAVTGASSHILRGME